MAVTIPRLRVSSLNALARRIGTCESSLRAGVVSGPEVIEPCLVVPFFLGYERVVRAYVEVRLQNLIEPPSLPLSRI